MVYDEIIGSGSMEVLLFDILGENKSIWYNNLKALVGTYLDIFNKKSNKEIEIVSLKEPIKY